MMVGSNLANVINYAYHPVMARLLGVASYGELASLISLLGLLSMLPASLGLVVTRLISGTPKEARFDLTSKINRIIVQLSIVVCVSLLLVSFLISSFLNLTSIWSVVMIAMLFWIFLRLMVVRSIFQALLRFKDLVASMMVENGLKLGLGVLLVMLGLKLNGALVGFGAGSLLTWLMFKGRSVPDMSQKMVANLKIGPFLGSVVPVLIQSVSITALYSSDLLLVKHFFSSVEAGGYSALSVLSRIIFFGTSPVVAVMFPYISGRKTNHVNITKIYLASLGLVALICLIVVGLFYLFPIQVISLTYGQGFVFWSKYLLLFGGFVSFLAISNLLSVFLVAMERSLLTLVPLLASIAQVLGIYLFHNSLEAVLIVSLLCTLILTIILVTASVVELRIEGQARL